MWSPDAFMFQEFSIHSTVFGLPVKNDYMMLSSGANQLSMPSIWKETIKKEIDEDFLYQWYTASTGFQAIKRSVEAYENFLFSGGDLFFKSNMFACMTIGASQAAFYAVSYLHHAGCQKMLFVGMNYPLYERVGRAFDYQMAECRSACAHRTTPTVEELRTQIEGFHPDVVVFTYPNNPSGEKYGNEEFGEILQILSEHNIYCIIDCVCNMMISDNEITAPEPLILKHHMAEKSIIVNSFSKTDSAPGFRIGYVLGNCDVIEFVSSKQADSIMNPQTIPVISIWITLLFRCLHLSEQYRQSLREREKIIRYFKRLFFVSTAIPPRGIQAYVEELLHHRIFEEYKRYKDEMLEKEETVFLNRSYACNKLHSFIIDKTNLEGGFNFLMKLSPLCGKSELDACKGLLEETGIAILTESAFSLAQCNNEAFWTRISLAAPGDIFKETIDRLYQYLLKIS